MQTVAARPRLLPCGVAALAFALHASAARAALPSHSIVPVDPALLHLRVIDVMFASLFIAAGISSCALAAAWNGGRGRTLGWIGLAAILYGLRLLEQSPLPTLGLSPVVAAYVVAFATYCLPLSLLAVARQVIGRGWLRSIELMWWLQIAYITLGLMLDAATHAGAGEKLNPVLVLCAIFVVSGNAAHVFWTRRRELVASLHFGSDLLLLGGATLFFLLLATNENLMSMHLLPWSFHYEPLGMFVMIVTSIFISLRRLIARDVKLVALTQELETARTIQTALLPRTLPEVAGIAMAARYQPAAEVGGDFYDVVRIAERKLGVLIVDVAGHGVPAALVASMVKVAFRGQLTHADDPARVLGGIRDQLLAASSDRRLVTAAYLLIDSASRTLTFSNAGHPPAIVALKDDPAVEELALPAPPLGAFRGVRYGNVTRPLPPGTRLVLYSDGIIEAPGAEGDAFGTDRFAEAITASRGGAVESAAQQIVERVNAWSARGNDTALEDDVTLLLIDVD